ncbi:MAG: electron transport complex subunit E [Ruminococcus sp.]|nr:electron transport complex subunit E [Ruminococcus sp.]
MQNNKLSRSPGFSGFIGNNTVFAELMVISPVIMCGDTLQNAKALIYAFSAVTFISVIICCLLFRLLRRLPYAIRIMTYAAVGSLVYIPIKLLTQSLYPGALSRIGIYFPLLAVNSLIILQTEARFFKMRPFKMTASLVLHILGFDAAIFIMSVIRELFAYGTLNSRMVSSHLLISGLGAPFGGFILLGLLCGLYRRLSGSSSDIAEKADDENKAKESCDVSDN